MFRSVVCVLAVAGWWAVVVAQEGQDVPTVDGKVTDVTVYQGQALVTRTVDLPGQEGLAEIVVSNLPEFVQPGSLYAEPVGAGVEIRSVRYRVRPMEQDVREEVRELDDQIKALAQEVDANQRSKKLLEERKAYLDKLENFASGTARAELESGVLNADTLKDLSTFLFSEREAIAEKDLTLSRELERLNGESEVLQRRRGQIAAGSARTVREAVVFANVAAGGRPQIKLNYLVSNATWSPSYNLRTASERDQVMVEYNAAIEQRSGEDWNSVSMTLSTATPSLVSQAPSLDPLVVTLGRQSPVQQQVAVAGQTIAGGFEAAKGAIAQRQKVLADNRGNWSANSNEVFAEMLAKSADQPQSGESGEAAGAAYNRLAQQFAGRQTGRGMGGGGFGGGQLDALTASEIVDFELNCLAEELQVLEYNGARFEVQRDNGPRSVAGEGVSVSYKLANRLSLPSRSDKQLLQISSRPLRGDFYRIATPVLTGYVYEEARLTNDTGDVMLAGPSNTFVAGQFVGRGAVPTVASGESLTVGLGIDTGLRATRELVDKADRVSGGNRIVDLTYELAIENFGDAPVNVRLLDRMPTSDNNEMTITLVKSDQDVSEDPAYQAEGLDDGLLRWDVEVPAKATGHGQFTLKYTIQMEYDKQLSITGGAQ